MLDIPLIISIAFIGTTVLTFWLFWKSSRFCKPVLWVSIVWLMLHGILAFSGFYQNLEARPPRITLTLGPSILFIVLLFSFEKGRNWIGQLNLKWLTLLHIIRVPVELILYALFVQKVIPELMTFTGRNWDILAGITAPLVYYFCYVQGTLGRKFILFWNVLCLSLLLNIVVNALLSTPLPFQQFAFEQPNRALFYFPFIWLPAYVVPVVLLSHVIVIYRTMKTP